MADPSIRERSSPSQYIRVRHTNIILVLTISPASFNSCIQVTESNVKSSGEPDRSVPESRCNKDNPEKENAVAGRSQCKQQQQLNKQQQQLNEQKQQQLNKQQQQQLNKQQQQQQQLNEQKQQQLNKQQQQQQQLNKQQQQQQQLNTTTTTTTE